MCVHIFTTTIQIGVLAICFIHFIGWLHLSPKIIYMTYPITSSL